MQKRIVLHSNKYVLGKKPHYDLHIIYEMVNIRLNKCIVSEEGCCIICKRLILKHISAYINMQKVQM